VVVDKGFGRVERLTDDLAITLANPEKGPGCLSNGGVVSGKDATLLVEGHFRPEGAALEIEAARTLSRKPIRGAVNTHFHLDHTFGNIGYAKEGIPILAHEQVPALMRQQYAAAKGTQRPVRAATGDARRHAQDLAADAWMTTAVDEVELAYPTELVRQADRTMRIDLGGVAVVLECEHAHTPGDLLVTVPDRDVMFVGDVLFVHEYPVSIDADMTAWRAVVGRLARQSRAMRIVPGHGPVCDRDAARAFADLLDDLRHHAQRMKKAGASADEAADRYVVPAPFQRYAIFSWAWTIGAAIGGYYRAS
jgi:glyoxylase-like metal-dependent hydrolase (beta-lactamase superfamily II)